MGGWPGGKPEERASSLITGSRIGCGSLISAPSTPRPLGRSPMLATVSESMPRWMNSCSRPSSPITPSAA